MSRLTIKPVEIPTNINYQVTSHGEYFIIWIVGPVGIWKYALPNNMSIDIFTNKLYVNSSVLESWQRFYLQKKHYKTNDTKIMFILALSNVMLRKLLIGASVGFRKYLKLRGVGFKFTLEKNLLTAQVGFSHLLQYYVPNCITMRFSRKWKMGRVYSKDLNILTSMISYLRNLKKPDPYKGKGIRYLFDPVLRKVGKKKKV